MLQRASAVALLRQSVRRCSSDPDEAQNLSFEALEELRMLSNIVVDRTMALQSFLLGQPQFRAILGSPRLEQLRQRVTAAYHLGPLSEAETKAYVEHRLRRADWKGDPEFTEDCFPLIYRHTGGVPRQINTLCSRLLLFGFLEQLHTLQANAVDKVAKDLREEIAVVTTEPIGAAAGPEPNGNSEGGLAISRAPQRARRTCRPAWTRHQARDRNRDQLFPERPIVTRDNRDAPTPPLRRMLGTGATLSESRRTTRAWRSGSVNAMTIDVEHHFQPEAFASTPSIEAIVNCCRIG